MQEMGVKGRASWRLECRVEWWNVDVELAVETRLTDARRPVETGNHHEATTHPCTIADAPRPLPPPASNLRHHGQHTVRLVWQEDAEQLGTRCRRPPAG